MPSSIKILISYHKPATLLKSDILTPINVGRALLKKDNFRESSFETVWLNRHMIGDDTGDNISEKNREFCELTSLYWAWKNLPALSNPEYLGFMHYRRHLCFDLNNSDQLNKYGLLEENVIDEEYIRKYKLDDANISSVVKSADIVTVKPCDSMNLGSRNNYDHYKSSSPYLHIQDYDKAIKILKEQYPEYAEDADIYNQSTKGYFTNIFIMKTPLFKEFASWLFNILFTLEKQVDLKLYNVQESRIFGYISEWLFGIWYTHNSKKYKCIELKRTFVKKTDYRIPYDFPVLKKENNPIVICYGTDGKNIPSLLVSIQSIVENISNKRFYEIHILHTNLTEYDRLKISKLTVLKNNIRLNFINLDYVIESESNNFDQSYTSNHITKGTYFRLYIPLVFRNYEKVLYIDSDTVLERDPSLLYDTALDDEHYVAAVRDTECIRWYLSDKSVREYIDGVMNFKDNIYDYFNAGVLLLNVKALVENKIYDKFIEAYKNIFKYKPRFHDQDILNITLHGKVSYINPKWNVLYHIPIWSPNWKNQIPSSLLYDYIESRHDPYLVHFAGAKKPWDDPTPEMADYFWKYASHIAGGSQYIQYIQLLNTLPSLELVKVSNKLKKESNFLSYLKFYKYTALCTLTKYIFTDLHSQYIEKRKINRALRHS